jgi:hypothetical protein
MNFDLSRTDVENLLAGFLTGTQAVDLGLRLTDLSDLPPACRTLLRNAAAAGRAWTAWVTEFGPMAAWADYDSRGSRQINAYLLFVEWWSASSGHHSLWCYCHPKRPNDWTAGRGHPDDPR